MDGLVDRAGPQHLPGTEHIGQREREHRAPTAGVSQRNRTRSRRGDERPTTRSVGWYGLKKWLRGRFGNYVPLVLEALGLAELEHNSRNNRIRARSPARRDEVLLAGFPTRRRPRLELLNVAGLAAAHLSEPDAEQNATARRGDTGRASHKGPEDRTHRHQGRSAPSSCVRERALEADEFENVARSSGRLHRVLRPRPLKAR